MANVYTDPLRIVIELDHDETEQLLNAGFTADLGSERQGEVIVGFFGATKGAGQAFDSGVQERRAVCH